MTLTVEVLPQTEAWLAGEAENLGIEPADVGSRVLDERAANADVNSPKPQISAKSAAAIEYLRKRMVDEATDDPEEIRQAELELEEFKGNLNADRAITGDRLVFP